MLSFQLICDCFKLGSIQARNEVYNTEFPTPVTRMNHEIYILHVMTFHKLTTYMAFSKYIRTACPLLKPKPVPKREMATSLKNIMYF